MIKRVYDIHGFDCASCAEKSEAHLGKADGIVSARIDFVSEKLYLTYEEEEFPIERIKALIKEVESDPIEITAVGEERKKKFDSETLFLLLRIAYCVAVFFICGFALKDLYWVRFGLYLSALVLIEYDIFFKVVRNIVKRENPLDEYLLIFLASTGAFVLASLKYASEGEAVAFGNQVFMMEEHFEAVLVCLLWQVGELLQSLAVKSSRRAIEKAVGSRVEEALLITEEGNKKVASKSLREGDVVLVNSGNLIPVDGEVIEGEGYCDTSSLTGESMPIVLKEGEKTYGGTLLTSGEVKVKASKDYASSASMKVLDLVTSSMEKKGEAEKFITKFARVYTPVIFLVAIAYILIAGFVGPSWRSAVYTGLEIMVISCPCAIVISVPLAYFASIGNASKEGIVIKGASYLDELNRIDEVCLDKTGTLTKGIFTLKEKRVDSAMKESEFNAIFRSLESLSNHPLAKAICLGLLDAPTFEVTHFESVLGYGVKGEIKGKTYYAGNAKYLETRHLRGTKENDGVYVYLFDETKVYGYVRLKDEAKNETSSFIASLHGQGITATLLSGDKSENVASFASEAGIVSYRADLLPEDKLSALEEKKAEGKKVAFLGDGVNDAPCLKRADVGVAMGGLGADMAIEESDVVLMQDNPMHFLTAVRIAKRCRKAVIFNIAFALAVKVAVLILAMVFKERMPMEIAVLSDTGLSVLLVFNSLLLLSRRN